MIFKAPATEKIILRNRSPVWESHYQRITDLLQHEISSSYKMRLWLLLILTSTLRLFDLLDSVSISDSVRAALSVMMCSETVAPHRTSTFLRILLSTPQQFTTHQKKPQLRSTRAIVPQTTKKTHTFHLIGLPQHLLTKYLLVTSTR